MDPISAGSPAPVQHLPSSFTCWMDSEEHYHISEESVKLRVKCRGHMLWGCLAEYCGEDQPAGVLWGRSLATPSTHRDGGRQEMTQLWGQAPSGLLEREGNVLIFMEVEAY